MTLKDLREIYERSSSRASEINRKLVFAGIAIVWLFHISDVSCEQAIPSQFLPILAFLCYSMVADILQYITRAMIWHAYYFFHREKDNKENAVETNEPEWYNALNNSFFYVKFIYTGFAYYYLASLLIGMVVPSIGLLESGLSLWTLKSVVCVWGIVFCVIVVWYALAPKLKIRKGRISKLLYVITHSEIARWLIVIVFAVCAICLLLLICKQAESEELIKRNEHICDTTTQPQPTTVITDTTLLNAIKTNQEAIIKLLQPKPEVKKFTTSKKVVKKSSSKAKKQPLYLPLDTITCDGKEYMIVEKVR